MQCPEFGNPVTDDLFATPADWEESRGEALTKLGIDGTISNKPFFSK